MPEYLSPGVYVEEVSSGSKPIEGVGTSTGAFVGISEKGPIGVAALITNWTQFVNTYGTFITDGYLAYGVYQFFNEGGTRCYVVRTCHYASVDDPTTNTSGASGATLEDGDNGKTIRIYASSDGEWGDKIKVVVEEATDDTEGLKLVIKYKNAKDEYVEVEVFDNLTVDNIEESVNDKSLYIKAEKDSWVEGGNDITGSGKKPKLNSNGIDLAGGINGTTEEKDGSTTGSIITSDYLGSGKAQNGLHAFDVIDDINIVLIPDALGNSDVTLGALTYCENRGDCFFVADSPRGQSPQDIKTYRMGKFNSSFGALYYPWIYISDPLTGKKKELPPSGTIAGTYANTDAVRGVHKAPAGTAEGYLGSVVGVEKGITKGEHDTLNPVGINVIRAFPAAGICVWGARTLSADPEWKYINIRRLFLYIEESIDEGSQWVVFEPNDPALWGSVKRNISAFLTMVWRDGALFGSTAEEAFYVKIDAENNPPEVRDAGQLRIEIGVAPVKPAEFVIIRISQKTLEK